MQTKLEKSIQMILITLIVIVIGTIIAGIISNNDVIANSVEKKCSVCNLKPADYIKTEFFMSHTTYYVCTECNYKTEKTEKCNLINFKKVDQNKHEAQCKQCRDWYDLAHVDIDKNGICDDCLYRISQSTNDKHICLDNSIEKIEIFDSKYHDYYAVCTLCENPVPDWQKREAHIFSKFTLKGSEGYSATCKICGYEVIQEHLKITSKKYKTDDLYISCVQPKTSVMDFKTNIETNGTQIDIYDNDNQLISGRAKIETGSKVEIKAGEITSHFIIIVNGDANGDGEANFKDLLKINQVRLNKTKINDIYSVAADVTCDEKIDFKDMVKINKFRLNKTIEL